MKPLLRDSSVHGLMQSTVFAQRILDRIESVLARGRHEGFDTIDLRTTGQIPYETLEDLFVVRIEHGQSLVAKVNTARTTDGACRLFLGDWKVFINDDPHHPVLKPGLHLWIGLAWRHIPS